MKTIKCDILIIGSGIIGLSCAYNLILRFPKAKIIIIEKDKDVALHASGRNSGVLHAGFYYNQDSLKAKFCKKGNLFWQEFCQEYSLKINKCSKVIVATDETQIPQIYNLYAKGIKNKVNVKIIDEYELEQIEPNAKTCKLALYSPNTATIDPKEICLFLKKYLINKGVKFYFKEPFVSVKNNIVITKNYAIESYKTINCSGVYADHIAKSYGLSKNNIIIPFKGVYLNYSLPDKFIRTNIYPLPHPQNPFLGVHFTLGVDNKIKIGPTAIPAFWRENYTGVEGFNLFEFVNISFNELKLFILNKSNFRTLALEELKKYNQQYLIKTASKLVKKINPQGFTHWGAPGIRAQLLNNQTLELVNDFVVEKDQQSIHILNAVSPAFTASIPFTEYIVSKYI